MQMQSAIQRPYTVMGRYIYSVFSCMSSTYSSLCSVVGICTCMMMYMFTFQLHHQQSVTLTPDLFHMVVSSLSIIATLHWLSSPPK